MFIQAGKNLQAITGRSAVAADLLPVRPPRASITKWQIYRRPFKLITFLASRKLSRGCPSDVLRKLQIRTRWSLFLSRQFVGQQQERSRVTRMAQPVCPRGRRA